jgi:hypothetical protein
MKQKFWNLNLMLQLALMSGLLLVSPICIANGSDNQSNDEVSKLKSWFNFLPVKDQEGIETYLSMVSNVRAGASVSIEKQNQIVFDQSPHFAKMTTQYYLWLLNKDLELMAGSGLNRPKLNDQNQNPGEHWRKALEIANGDSHLAARMISMLGHDDAMKEPLSISPTMSGYDEYLKVRKEIFDRAIEKAKMKHPSIVSDLVSLSSASSNVLRVSDNST